MTQSHKKTQKIRASGYRLFTKVYKKDIVRLLEAQYSYGFAVVTTLPQSQYNLFPFSRTALIWVNQGLLWQRYIISSNG